MSRPIVAEVLSSYLPLTETFIYAYLTSFTRVHPAVFAHEISNQEKFPIDDLTWIRLPGVARRLVDKIAFQAVGRRPFRDSAFLQVVGSRRPQLIHGHFGWTAATTLPLKRDLGLPLVTTFYGVDMSALPKDPHYARLYETLFDEGDLFLVEGSHMRNALHALGCPLDKIKVQHIGVDSSSIQFRERTKPLRGHVQVLMCSSFREKKGIRYGVEAFANVRNRYRGDVRLVIAGDGPLRPEIERQIERLDLSDVVSMVGYVDHRRFYELAENSHLFMAPSLTASDGDTEGGAPTVLIEAQASGMPVVSTLHADIPEVVVDGVTGLLAEEGDSEGLADCLLHLLEHPDCWPAMGKAGRSRVEDSYDLARLSSQLEDTYMALMAGVG